MRAPWSFSWLIVGFCLAGCIVSPLDLAGKGCDEEHPCSEGFACLDGICRAAGSVAPDASAARDAGPRPDAGRDAGVDGGPPCTSLLPFCEGARYLRCEAGRPVVLIDCAPFAAECDEAAGCVWRCGGDAGDTCPAGRACDRATHLCLGQPVCDEKSACPDGGLCARGACLTPPPPTPLVLTRIGPDGWDASAPVFDCHDPDAKLPEPPDGGFELVTLEGHVLTHYGTDLPGSEFLLRIFEARRFLADPTASPVAMAPTLPAGDAGFPGFRLEKVPVETRLVSLTTGLASAFVPTYEYFVVGADKVVDGVALRNPVVFGRQQWEDLVAGARAQVTPGRAGISGQLFDCQPRTIAGGTAALDVEGGTAAVYTDPVLFAPDPKAASTTALGRFLFFDVPATALRVESGARGDAGVLTWGQEIRTVPGSVTVVRLRPDGR